MDTECCCLGRVTLAVRRLTVWKKFVLLSVTDKTHTDDPFNKLRQETEIRDGPVGAQVGWVQTGICHSKLSSHTWSIGAELQATVIIICFNKKLSYATEQ